MVMFDTYVGLPEGMMFLDKIRAGFAEKNLFSLGFDVFPLPQPETLPARSPKVSAGRRRSVAMAAEQTIEASLLKVATLQKDRRVKSYYIIIYIYYHIMITNDR